MKKSLKWIAENYDISYEKVKRFAEFYPVDITYCETTSEPLVSDHHYQCLLNSLWLVIEVVRPNFTSTKCCDKECTEY